MDKKTLWFFLLAKAGAPGAAVQSTDAVSAPDGEKQTVVLSEGQKGDVRHD